MSEEWVGQRMDDDWRTDERMMAEFENKVRSKEMGNHHSNPVPATIKTADGHTVSVGDEVHNYYDCKTGFIEKISHGDVPDDGWADLSGKAGFVNGERMSTSCNTCGYGIDFRTCGYGIDYDEEIK